MVGCTVLPVPDCSPRELLSLDLTVLCLGLILILAVIGYMYYPRRRHGEPPRLVQGGRTLPPEFNPEDHTYPLREWLRDVQHWLITTEYHPAASASYISRSLRGSAERIARNYTVQQLT